MDGVNANDIRQYIRQEDEVNHIIKGQKVGCTICLVIHPQYRSQGFARLLIKQAINNSRDQRFNAVLALPLDDAGESEKLYRGTINMYLELGFKVIE